MTGSSTLTAELRAEVLAMEEDLRTRVARLPDVRERWQEEYAAALAGDRAAASWEAWSDERVTLAAVGWVLTTVFVRFCEDNDLVTPVWIAGPGQRREEALHSQAEFLRQAARTDPDVTDREWLLEAVHYLQTLPATAGLVDASAPIWLVTPSGDAAARLLAYWRERDDDGRPLRDLTDPGLDTRFLGDLYQDVSEEARKRYALLQTPTFVEEFILDRTLTPALDERPLEGFAMIDPTCGSGHFLLGAFARLLDRWHRHAPALDERERVQLALDAVHGVDLNPFAVAIAKFRLTVAALQASGTTRLEDAPAFKYHLAAGDSLLHGLDQGELDLGAEHGADRTAATFTYAGENLAELRHILRNGRYDAVVGNPPYITVKDKALNALYRERYSACHRQYALTVPFMQRFFWLAKPGGTAGEVAGWVGQITSNSFMKREFGSKLIEGFLPTKDLRLVADTSGAYIPGHGTPTVIIVGRNDRPVLATVRAVLGVRGEPGRPDEPAKGLVWSSIVEHVDEPGWSDDFVTVSDLDRRLLGQHPWSLSGGGAVELLGQVERSGDRLADRVALIGYTGQTNADDVFLAAPHAFDTRSVEPESHRQMVVGEVIRDYRIGASEHSIFLYDADKLMDIEASPGAYAWMWPARTVTWTRATFAKNTYREEGRTWWEWHQVALDRLRTPLSIAFAFVATHNHFVLDRGGKVFNRSAPVIKLPEGAGEEEHLALLGVLNSSAACFWLKQVCHSKGSQSGTGGFMHDEWEEFYEFTGTTLQDFPLPATLPLDRGRHLDHLARQLSAHTPSAMAAAGVPTREALDKARATYDSIRAEMVAEQEELDWETYRLYGLVDEDLTYPGDDLPPMSLGERAFEILLARKVADGEEETAWFDRHGSTPVTDIPAQWPAAYQDLVARRIELAAAHPYLRLLERPEHKRRWASEPWERQEERALRGWLLGRLEDRRFWFDAAGRPTPRSVAHLADSVGRDPHLVSVLALWEGRPDVPVAASLQTLLATEAVPFLAAYRYKDSGLRKRAAWEHTWELQRREDAGSYDPRPRDPGGDGPIPVPPKYTGADFRRQEYWSHRGKLDVPKERFVLYPGAGRETDPSPVLGWAGWDHAHQALALAILVQARDSDGWPEERLAPLVAGLAELLGWVRQWHADPDPLYGGVSPAEFFAEQLDRWARQVGRTVADLAEWRPDPPRRGRAAARAPEGSR